MSPTLPELLTRLHATLDRRPRPEDLLPDLLALGGWEPAEERRLRLVRAVARNNAPWGWSSMSGDFWRPVGLERQLRKAAELFPGAHIPLNLANDPQGARAVLGRLWQELGAEVHQPDAPPDFLHGRLNRAQRAQAGIELSNHAYNKRFRLARRLALKRLRLERQLRQRALLLASKSRLASRLSLEEFGRERAAAAFVAYYTSSANRRSVFSAWGQERAKDDVAALLLDRCRRTPECNWYAVAHVYPTPEVLSHLSDTQKGALLGQVGALMAEAAELMRGLWARSSFRRESMVVKRGDDSSTWNLLAGAWNQLRDGWINLLYALGAEAVLEEQLPGKVMRLMAADVAYIHRAWGKGGLDPNTQVWNALPLPWEVLSGAARCTWAEVEGACAAAGLHPVRSGWTGPRREARTRPFTPTPELVHGVAVHHPALALWLRSAGVFSGKAIKAKG